MNLLGHILSLCYHTPFARSAEKMVNVQEQLIDH